MLLGAPSCLLLRGALVATGTTPCIHPRCPLPVGLSLTCCPAVEPSRWPALQLDELRRLLETTSKTMEGMSEWTEEIKFDLVRLLLPAGCCCCCCPPALPPALACGRMPATHAPAAAHMQLLDRARRPPPAAHPQEKHRHQFSPADKISEQPAGAIGAQPGWRHAPQLPIAVVWHGEGALLPLGSRRVGIKWRVGTPVYAHHANPQLSAAQLVCCSAHRQPGPVCGKPQPSQAAQRPPSSRARTVRLLPAHLWPPRMRSPCSPACWGLHVAEAASQAQAGRSARPRPAVQPHPLHAHRDTWHPRCAPAGLCRGE